MSEETLILQVERRTQTTAGSAPTERLRAVLRYDLPASLVVFLVALPLSLGIAVASDAPVLAGLISAIVGGIVAGALGGSVVQVSGPAAGLTVIVAGLVGQFGWAVTCAITVAAGIVQVLLGLSRVARAALAISPFVVHAMLAGIGITIALQQAHVLLGGESASSAWDNLLGMPAAVAHADPVSVVLGTLVIAIMLGWGRLPGLAARIPGPLVAIVAVTALSVAAPVEVTRIALDGSLLDAITLPQLPDGHFGAVVVGVLTVAMIASIESLLSAVAVDRMHTGPRTDFNRELIGQGSANIVAGTLGGLPITGVIVRSATNVGAGARSRASAILHGVWVLLFAVPFCALIEQIPTAALAGLLIVIGARLVRPGDIRTAWRTGNLTVYLVTLAGVVLINLLAGVLLGLALAITLTGWQVVRAKVATEQIDDTEWRLRIEGACTFLSLPKLTAALATLPPGTTVTVETSTILFDHAAQDALDDWQHQHCARGGTVHRDTGAAVAV